MHKVSLSSSCSPDRRRRKISSGKKTTAVLKKVMTEKDERWKSREWDGSTKTRWQQPAESTWRQSSVDAWEHAKPQDKWTEVSADCRVLEALVREKKITWTKSGRESAEREAELFDMLEKAATNEKREGRGRDKLGDKLEAFLTRREEEDEATGLMEEMRKNVVAAQKKVLMRNSILNTPKMKIMSVVDGLRNFATVAHGHVRPRCAVGLHDNVSGASQSFIGTEPRLFHDTSPRIMKHDAGVHEETCIYVVLSVTSRLDVQHICASCVQTCQ